MQWFGSAGRGTRLHRKMAVGGGGGDFCFEKLRKTWIPSDMQDKCAKGAAAAAWGGENQQLATAGSMMLTKETTSLTADKAAHRFVPDIQMVDPRSSSTLRTRVVVEVVGHLAE